MANIENAARKEAEKVHSSDEAELVIKEGKRRATTEGAELMLQKDWSVFVKKLADLKTKIREVELDEGIGPILMALWAHDFNSSSSCFGHIHDENKYGNRIFLPFVLLGVDTYDVTGSQESIKDKIFFRLLDLVAEFYKDRKNDGFSRLRAIRRGFGYALNDVFLGTVGTMDDAVQKLDKKDLESTLQSAQNEFNAFAEFLKRRFLEEQN